MPSLQSYADATAYLFGLRRFGWRPGLETVTRLLDLVGNPQAQVPTIHVGGTNGKGSTAAMLAAILQAAGYRTGLYTSPHLASFTERIRVNGEPIGEAEVLRFTAELSDACAGHFAEDPKAPPPAGRLAHPTFFELTTAMAFLHFLRQQAEVAVIEVGLGGRLDATNVIRPAAVLLTNIGLDHQQYLGTTLVEIAGEKAGIIKAGVPVLTAAEGEALDVFRRVAAERGAPLHPIAESHRWRLVASDLTGITLDLSGPAGEYRRLAVPLSGTHQLPNVVLAVAAAEVLASRRFRLDEVAIRAGLASVRWPGRLQSIPGAPRILLDGAHNPAGAAALAAFLREQRGLLGRLALVFGVLADKDWRDMLPRFFSLADAIVLTRPPTDRGQDPAAVRAAYADMPGIAVCPDLGEAIAEAKVLAGPEGTVLVTGSLYTVAAAFRVLGLPVL
jgi:dihydrofolate synthase/folylpolyglutamate synthase